LINSYLTEHNDLLFELLATFGYIFSRSILSKLDDEEEVVGARQRIKSKKQQHLIKTQQFYK